MSTKLPVLSGDQLIKALEKFGYVVMRQKGSHIRLRHATDSSRLALSVPRHSTLKKGLLRRVLRDARISLEQLLNSL